MNKYASFCLFKRAAWVQKKKKKNQILKWQLIAYGTLQFFLIEAIFPNLGLETRRAHSLYSSAGWSGLRRLQKRRRKERGGSGGEEKQPGLPSNISARRVTAPTPGNRINDSYEWSHSWAKSQRAAGTETHCSASEPPDSSSLPRPPDKAHITANTQHSPQTLSQIISFISRSFD